MAFRHRSGSEEQKKGYVQPDGEFKGFFVSQTSLRDGARSDLDPAKYVNAAAVPYLVFPGAFHQKAGTGTLGDLGYAVNLDNGKTSAFIVAEVGPSDAKLGKCRLPWRRRWAGRTPIRARAPASRTARSPTWCFRKAGPIPRGLTNQQIGDRVQDLLKQLPGAWRPSRLAAPTRNRRRARAGPHSSLAHSTCTPRLRRFSTKRGWARRIGVALRISERPLMLLATMNSAMATRMM